MSAEEALPFLPKGILLHAHPNMFTLPLKFDAAPADRRRLKLLLILNVRAFPCGSIELHPLSLLMSENE